jgi:membrane associated rhomboid family serine protease
MVDLNHILLFLAVVSPLAVLARSWRLHSGHDDWRIAAGVVLGITGFAWMLARNEAGYIGTGVWFVVLFLPAMGLKRMTELSTRRHYRAARRLANALRWLHPSRDLRNQTRELRYLEARQLTGDLPPPSSASGTGIRWKGSRLHDASAVTLLIIVNAFVFAIELYFFATTPNEGVILLKLGALQPALVLLGHQYWRLIAALFLHANTVHLLFNMFALFVLGPQLERSAGSLRFLICYLGAGLCSTAGVLILWRVGIVQDAEVVGASGCVMGIVGALAAFLIRDHQTPLVRRRLGNIIMIVVIQTIFDITTPQVSMSAHLCGLVGGFIIGLLVSASPLRRSAFDQRPSFSG